MKGLINFICGITLMSFIFFNCSPATPYDHIDSEKVRSIIKKGIDQAGGLEAWKGCPGYQLTKRSISYLKNGTVESKSNQLFEIQNVPNLSGLITWNNRTDTVSTKIEYTNGSAIKYIDNKKQGRAINETAKRYFLSQYRVLSMPFKLSEPGLSLSYLGQEVMFNKKVEVIFEENNSQQWWHYFDASSFEYLGYKVNRELNYSLVENLKTSEVGGINFVIDEITWEIDSLNNKQFIKAKSSISDLAILGN